MTKPTNGKWLREDLDKKSKYYYKAFY